MPNVQVGIITTVIEGTAEFRNSNMYNFC